MKQTKYKIGNLLGSNNSLLVLDYQKINNEKRLFYKVQCQICKKDKELFGDAIYIIDSQYFISNKLPCGCSKSTRYSEDQLRVILTRKTKLNNHEFIDFEGGKHIDQDTKLIIKCKSCNNDWTTCSLNNYMKDRGCPHCANKLRANNKITPDNVWINRFRATDSFPEDKYSFLRISPMGRLWNVYCKTCGIEKSFVADRANLAVGKVPCDCVSGGGFDINKIGYFYILKVLIDDKISLKYGITNFYKRRIADHNRTLKTVNGVIIEKLVFMGNGKNVLSLESELKRTVPAENKFIEGFRKESCSIDFYESLLQSVYETDLEKITMDT